MVARGHRRGGRAGQRGGACGWLVVIARPAASVKAGLAPWPLVWMWWSWRSVWWRGQSRMRLASSALPAERVGDDVVSLKLAAGGAAGVLAVSACALVERA